MKKYISLILSLSACAWLLAQNKMLFHLGTDTEEINITDVDTIRFNNGSITVTGPANKHYQVGGVDSVTFALGHAVGSDTVFVTYNGNSVVIDNPFPSIAVTNNGANVSIESNAETKGIVYCLSGKSADGSFSLTPDKGFTLCLDNLDLTSTTTAPICLNAGADGNSYTANVHLRGATTLADGSNSNKKGAIYSKSKLKISDDTLHSNTSLTLKGNAKHALSSSKRVELYSGKLEIASAAGDGINADGLEVYGGELAIAGTQGDGVDCSEIVRIENGTVNVVAAADDVKAIKCDSVVEIVGGDVTTEVSGAGSKAVKAGVKATISGGTLDVTLSAPKAFVDDANDYNYNAGIASNGDIEVSETGVVKVKGAGIAARALSADANILVSGGSLDVDLTGYYSIETENNDTTSCYGIKADNKASLAGGTVNIAIGDSAKAAKGIMAESIDITGGDITIVNKGGFWYKTTTSSSSNQGGQNRPGGGMGGWGGMGGSTSSVESTTPKAIRGKQQVNILAGKLNLTVPHGKGITSDNAIVIGNKDANDSELDLAINTGSNGDPTYLANSEKNKYLPCCSPKSIHSDNTVEVNSGNVTIDSYDSAIKGSEVTVNGGVLTLSAPNDQGIHGVQKLTINGGDILVTNSFEAFEGTSMVFNGGVTSVFATDDGWNASTSTSGIGTPSVTVNGGYHYISVGSGDTDALDSNGSMSFQGGVVIIETGNVSLDCDSKPSFGSDAVLMLFCKSSETLPTTSTNLSVSSIKANTRYTASANGNVKSSFTTTQSATQLIYISNTTPTFTSGATYTPGNNVELRGKNNTKMVYSYGGSANGGTTLSSTTASAQGMGGGGRW